MLSPICIIPLLPVPEELIASIVHPLHSIFQTHICVEQPVTGFVEKAFDDSRGQYNSTDIIRQLLENQSDTEHGYFVRNVPVLRQPIYLPTLQSKILGITSVDLFVPVLTYVFGEAQLEGTACVVSTYRLDNTIYGLPADPVLFFERTLKESVHELGHTYGLYHCRNLECAMHSSTAVEDIDVKGGLLCGECRKKIGL